MYFAWKRNGHYKYICFICKGNYRLKDTCIKCSDHKSLYLWCIWLDFSVHVIWIPAKNEQNDPVNNNEDAKYHLSKTHMASHTTIPIVYLARLFCSCYSNSNFQLSMSKKWSCEQLCGCKIPSFTKDSVVW